MRVKNFKFLFILISITLFLWVLTTAVFAQEEPPPPYAGLQNPFPWEDTSVQEAGKQQYQLFCLGCHGATGNSMAGADFGAADFPQRLEARPDFYFWTVSEGRLAKGMPPFKSSLSEEQRWQIITYLWSLSTTTAPPEVTPPARPPAEGITLQLTAPDQTQPGQPLTLSAALRDKEGQPIGNVPVKFFIRADFFTSGLMEIGETLTNDQGVAVREFTPRQTGELPVVARYQDDDLKEVESTITVHLAEKSGLFYQSEAGLRSSTPIPEVFIGPQSALGPGADGSAPMTGFRIPGGLSFWLLMAYVSALIMVWSLYFRVMYLVFRIPVASEITDTNTRLLPIIIATIMVSFAIMLVLVLLTGPYSHPHLLR